jgi:hypothetical protein
VLGLILMTVDLDSDASYTFVCYVASSSLSDLGDRGEGKTV